MIQGLYECFNHWHKEGTVWIYSDTHFNDEELESKHPRPISTEEHIKRINAKVGKKDTLILLGDVGDIECVKKLRAGRKILIMGNHDSGRTNYERKRQRIRIEPHRSQSEALAQIKQLYPNCKYKIEGWDIEIDNQLFDEVYEGALIIGEKLILSHEPLDIPWAYNIHGHDHVGEHRSNRLNCCADVIGYEPVNLNQFMKSGAMKGVTSLHRMTIEKAKGRKKWRW